MTNAPTGDDGREAAALVRARTDLRFEFGLVLGSGLGGLAGAVEDAVRIPYADLPGMPASRVSSHAMELVAGRLEGVPVVVLSGRAHAYETGDSAVMRPAMGMLRQLGCDAVILTNAAGSLKDELSPGMVMLVTDHIGLGGRNPLVGEPTDARFVGMTNAYDRELLTALVVAALSGDIAFEEGVYMWVSGPSFETPAEIRAARTLGADAIGMSTVPEVILARFFGLRVAALSTITNYAAGMTGAELSHEETKRVAGAAAGKLETIIRRFLRDHRAGGKRA